MSDSSAAELEKLRAAILALLNAGDSREWRLACENAKAVLALKMESET